MKPFISGFVIWLAATSFFIFFGKQVLVAPTNRYFFLTFLLLEIGTALVLFLLTLLYRKWDKNQNALLRFGIIGSIVGLALDAVSLSNHAWFFPNLSAEQLLSFAIWMCFAYALYLAIPSMMYLRSTKVT